MSARASVRRLKTVMSGGRRSAVMVTIGGCGHLPANPHRASADSWLSTAVGPQARTAAAARSSGVDGGRPIA
jgi:hypothetical protein